MKNREWLESLSDERFAEVVASKVRFITWLWKGETNEKYMVKDEFCKWLQAKHKEVDE